MLKKLNPKAIGERTEGIVLAHLLRRGAVVLMPFGNNQRYDLVVDINNDGTFLRGQCKTAVYRRGCVRFHPCSSSGGKKCDYRGQVDVFWVHCPELDKVYQVPVEDVGTRQALLRVDAPRGGSKSNIRWASRYEL